MTFARRCAVALVAPLFALVCAGAEADGAVEMPAVTNVATFLVQVTNSTTFALLPTNMPADVLAPAPINAEDQASLVAMTNLAAMLPPGSLPAPLAPRPAGAVASPAAAPALAASATTNAPAAFPPGYLASLGAANTNVAAGVLGVISPEAALALTNTYFDVATNQPVVGVGPVVTNLVNAALDVRLKQAAQDAVVQAVNAVNLAAEKVAAAEVKRRISTRTFLLQYASPEEVAERFNTMWSGDFGIAWKVAKIAQAFPEANSVMVTAPGVILDACEQALKVLDVKPRQVYIEARFVELQNSAEHKLGIDWSMLDGMGGTASFGGGLDKRNIGNAVQNYSRTVSSSGDTVTYGLAGKTTTKRTSSSETQNADGTHAKTLTSDSTSTASGRDGGVSYFSGTLSFTDMSLVLSALDTSGDAKIFSNPKIIVSNGKRATVDMTEKYPNVAINAKRTLNGNSESLDLDMKMAVIPGEDKLLFAKEAFFSWGISLEVMPRVISNDLITVSIVPTISEKSGEVTAGSGTAEGSRYPIISVQRLVTDFTLKAGSTAVIGGLSKTTEEQVDTGIPWLRDWPWIGDKLFGSKSRRKVQKEILVFVTVGIADPDDVKTDVGLPKNAVLGRMYTTGVKFEPGDRTGNAIEGIAALDTRSLDEQARDPLATNHVEKATFHLPFGTPEKKKEEIK